MKKIVIIAGAFHRSHIEKMVNEAQKVAEELNLEIVDEIWVPGSLEVPLLLKQYLEDKSIDGAVILGIIEKGETQHGLVMGQAVTKTIIELQLEYNKPVGVGILGPGIIAKQIPSRLIPYARNAVKAVYDMLLLLK